MKVELSLNEVRLVILALSDRILALRAARDAVITPGHDSNASVILLRAMREAYRIASDEVGSN